MKHSKTTITVLSLNLLSASLLMSGAHGFDHVGLRVGTDAVDEADLMSYEIFGVADTPWGWEFSGGHQLLVEFELVGGVLDGEGSTGGFFKVAPQLRLQSDTLPLEFVLSSGPTYLTDQKFGDLNMGGSLQFTSAAGRDWQINEDWTLGYRYQHMSNASIYDVNDGLNLHSLSFDYRF